MKLKEHLTAVLVTLGAAAASAIGAGLLVVASGAYNVAATKGHWPVTRDMLEFAMWRSVSLHAPRIEPPDLDDADMIQLGAAHYQGGCAPCHGAPGEEPNPIPRQMLPFAPNLAEAGRDWSDPQLFFIIRHGLKYTGMPAWAALDHTAEIWAVAAFVRAMPGMEAAAYRDLAMGNVDPLQLSAAEIDRHGPWRGALAACGRCHEAGGQPPASALTPALAGQPADYLAMSLRAYASGARASGIMEPVAAQLDDADIERLADYFAQMAPDPGFGAPEADPEALARGAALAARGDPERAVPACLSCHGEPAMPAMPRLGGQSQRYLASQLRLFRDGVRGGPPRHTVMQTVAERMTDAQIDEAAAFFAAQGGAAPAGAQRRTAAAEETP